MIHISNMHYDAPGPGSWQCQLVHQDEPLARILIPQWEEGYTNGFRRGFADVGSLLDTLEARVVNGWIYIAARPVGAPPTAKSAPPKWIFKALVTFHPELRRRCKRAAEAWTTKPWRNVNAQWENELGPGYRKRLVAMQAQDLTKVKDLGAELDKALTLFREAFETHFVIAGQIIAPIGDLFMLAEKHGVSAHDAQRATSGTSPETTRPRQHLEAIVTAAPRGLAADDPELLAKLRAHGPSAKALDAYLAEYGWRAMTGSPSAPTLIEQPEMLATGIRSAMTSSMARGDADAQKVAERIRAKLPEADRAEWDVALEEARNAGKWREEHVAMFLWAIGLVRRVLLEVAQRLGGRVPEGTIFDNSRDEIFALLDGKGPPPEELLRRLEHRKLAGAETPPEWLGGKSGGPPPAEWLPAGAARLARAAEAFVKRFESSGDTIRSDASIAGHGVSPGVVEGIARHVRITADLANVEPGAIIVARSTSVGFNASLAASAGVVTEFGGVVCHAAIVSRELGIPGVVGCKDALDRIPNGALIRVDGEAGTIEILDRSPKPAPKASVEAVVKEARQPRLPVTTGIHVSLAEADGRFGGKASGLATAIKGGLPVPGGLALDANFVEAIAAGDAEHLAKLTKILANLRAPLAVRSSALGEDSTAASFAGVHHTALGLKHADVASAVRDVWMSAHGAAALAYRTRRGIEGDPQMAVVIQEIIDAEVAGVFFSRDPIGKDGAVIEASWGLGVAVVDGRVTPDRVRLDTSGKIIERAVGDKPVMIVLDENGTGTTEQAGRADSCLDSTLVRSVYALGQQAAELAGPADVEWALAKGKVWLLQSRPITT